MRIAIVGYFNPKCVSEYLLDNNIPDIHNAATAVNTLVVSLLRAGHYVKVFTSFPEKGEPRVIFGKNIEIHLVSEAPIMNHLRFLSRIYMVHRLIKLMKGNVEDVDVIHAHWTYDFALAAKHFAGIKRVVCTVRDWCPYILSVQPNLKSKIRWLVSYAIFRMVMKGEQVRFIANSQYTYDRILSDYPHKNVQIIPNPIEQSLILSEKKNKNISHKFISIAQNIDDKRKNISILVKAFELYKKEYPNAVLTLVGNYDANGELYKNITNQSTANIIVTGKLSRTEIINLIDESSCLVHPSLEETFGNILLEAMARKVPCIGGKKSGAVTSVLGNGECGVLCDVTDYKAVYDAMKRINESNYRDSIVDYASKMLGELYSSDIIADKHIDFYVKILSEES